MHVRPGPLLAAWVLSGICLAIVAASAWAYAPEVQVWIGRVQQAYGWGPSPPWLMHSDTHLHMLASLSATTWFGVGCRLFAPRHVLWAPPALAVLLALFDEMAQLGSAQRTFDWGDQAADAIGIALAIPLLLLLRSLKVSGPPRS